MVTILIAENKDRVEEILSEIVERIGNENLNSVKDVKTIKVLDRDSLRNTVSLRDKIVELEELLHNEKNGVLYKSILDRVEKPLFEQVLERTEGNQLKAARILGINRNTMRAKIKKLGISTQAYKHN